MIPRAIEMIFDVSKHLQDRGWKYQMEGQFLEVYNEVVSGHWAGEREGRS
jgi:kinesin family protein C1